MPSDTEPQLDTYVSSPPLVTELDHRTNVYKPTRLNFARVCIYCGETDCTSIKCIDAYSRSAWGACDECDGGRREFSLCTCLHGVVELTPAQIGRRA